MKLFTKTNTWLAIFLCVSLNTFANGFVPKPYSYTALGRTSNLNINLTMPQIFEYPEGISEDANLDELGVTVVVTDVFGNGIIEKYDYKYNTSPAVQKQQLYLRHLANKAGYAELDVKLTYLGQEVTNKLKFDIKSIISNNDSYYVPLSTEPFSMDVLTNDQFFPTANKNTATLSIKEYPVNGTLNVVSGSPNTFQYIPNTGLQNYTKDSFTYKVTDANGISDSAAVNIDIHLNPYASRAIEFMPAPGQFVNEAIAKSTSAEAILGNGNSMISLGGFGGYVILGFDQPIVNRPENPYGVDFSVNGNSFVADLYGVWVEPAAVQVMKDVNGNGIPDDGEWYELAGSDYWLSTTKRNVEMTYYNPHYDVRYTIPWKTNHGERGAQITNVFHLHPYYPDPFDFNCDKDSLTYSGNIILSSLNMSTPNYIEFDRAPAFGYADNRGNNTVSTNPQNPYYKDEKGKATDGFDLSWAVDRDGNHVELDTVHFVKIYTAGSANAGWLGEWSSEVVKVSITTPDPTYVPQDYYVNYIGITQVKVLKGQSCKFDGFLFKNGRPVDEGTPTWWTSDTSIGTVDNAGNFTGVESGDVWLYFQQKNDIPKDSIPIKVRVLESVHIEIEGYSSAASNDSVEMIIGESIYITVQGLDNSSEVLNGSTANRYTYEKFNWTTSNPEIGEIDNGLFISHKTGRTMLHAYASSNSELVDSILVIVNNIPKLNPVDNPVKIPYYDYIGEKTGSQLFATGTGSTTYLNSVVSKNGRTNPVIDKNILKYSIAEGDYGRDTLTFDLTYYKKDTTISVVFVHEPDGFEKPEQVLYVNNALFADSEKSTINSFLPSTGKTETIDTVPAYTVRAVLADGAFAFVRQEDTLSKYNVTTYEKIGNRTADKKIVADMAVYNNLLLVAGHDEEQSSLAVYYKTDLQPAVKEMPLSGLAGNIAVIGDTAYIPLTDKTSKQLNALAVVNLYDASLVREEAIASNGLIPSSILKKGNTLYTVGRNSKNSKTAILEYNTADNTYTVSDIIILTNTMNAVPAIKDDNILLADGEGFIAYNTVDKTLAITTLMKADDDYYPTGILFDADLNNYFVSYSNADKTASKARYFDADFATINDFEGAEVEANHLTGVQSISVNEAPKAVSSTTLSNYTIYEKATSASNADVYKNRFSDKENDYAIYPRNLEYQEWLPLDLTYNSSAGHKRLKPKYADEIDTDSVVTIGVDAIDNYGFSVMRTFNITIKPRIYQPIVLNPISDKMYEKNTGDVVISLADVFKQTASSGVTFTKTITGNSNSELITANLENDDLLLSITPENIGETLITLRLTGTHATYGEKFVETSFTIFVVEKQVTGVELNESSISIPEKTTYQLTATVLPEEAYNKNVRWESSNTAVATVDADGLVTAVQPGSATITVTTENGGYTADCELTVTKETSLSALSARAVYPNPFTTQLFVDLKEDAYVAIYNISGLKVFGNNLKQGSNRINTSTLPEGVYVLRVGSENIKLIKK